MLILVFISLPPFFPAVVPDAGTAVTCGGVKGGGEEKPLSLPPPALLGGGDSGEPNNILPPFFFSSPYGGTPPPPDDFGFIFLAQDNHMGNIILLSKCYNSFTPP